MRAFLSRLRLCWQLLHARRFVLFLPAHPVLHPAVGGAIGPATWAAINRYVTEQHAQALYAADARLLADIAALDTEVAEAHLAEIKSILHSYFPLP